MILSEAARHTPGTVGRLPYWPNGKGIPLTACLTLR